MKNLLAISFVVVTLTSLVTAQQQNDLVKSNQLGYYPNSPKIAITPSYDATEFYIIDAETEAIVYLGNLENGGTYNLSGEQVKIADFTDFTRQGTYILGIIGGNKSFPFEIKNNVYQGLNDALIKALYYNRASTELLEEHSGEWHRPMGHSDTNVLIHSSAATENRPEGSSISSPGGWYDAGDFNKYVVPISSSIHHILFAYERFPSFFSSQDLNIPESGDAIPDVLDEAKYAIDWLLTMQDPDDGGVYHKLTHSNFQATIMPHQTNNPRYVVQKSTSASLDFAAVMAQAARVYKPFYPEFSENALQAAINAFEWAQTNPNLSYNQSEVNAAHDPDINTGSYGDGNFSDEFFWARSELYITTGEDQYYPDNGWAGVGVSGWSGVQALGLFSLLNHRNNLTEIGLTDTTSMKNALLNAFTWYVDDAKNAPYRSPFGLQSWQFSWGSNGGAGNLGMGIMMAFELTGDQKYYEGAIHIMDYLMGRNPVAYSYVTGFGTRYPMNIHHRQSEADNISEPIPGWVAGGANPGNQNQDCGSNAYSSTLPALSYLDDYCSYSTNEVTTYWNSPFVYITSALEMYTEEVISNNNPDIIISSPTKNVMLDVGEDLPISWNSTEATSLDLSYRLFSQNGFTEIASGVDASIGSYSEFKVPDVPGDSLFIKIQNSANSTEVYYSPIVYITPSKSIRSVNASTTFNLPFKPGRKVTISWDTIALDSLDIFYYLQSNSQLQAIANKVPAADLKYNEFIIPDAPGDVIFFRISDSADTTIYRDSPGYEIPSSVHLEQEDHVTSFNLLQNYPNPFNPNTEISFSIPETQQIKLTIYDISGRQVAVLVDGVKHTGWHKISFDASNLSSGLYVYQLRGISAVQTKKMMLLK